MTDKTTIVNLLPGQVYDLRSPDRKMRFYFPEGKSKSDTTRLTVRDLGTWVEPVPPPVDPPPPPPPSGPLNEPHTAAPAVPAGLAAGTLTLQQAVDATPAGGILNASIPGKVWREKITINRPLTIVGYGATVAGDLAKVEEWFLVFSSDVTIEGFVCRTSGLTQPDSGGIQLGGYSHAGTRYDRLTLRNLDLDGRAGAPYRSDLYSIQGGGASHKVLGCRWRNGGRSAITGSGMTAMTIARSEFDHNSTGITNGSIDVGNDGGAIKLLFHDGTVLEDNFIHDNFGRGLWTDTGSKNFDVRANRLWDNAYNGAFLESSHDFRVYGNDVRRNARAAAAHPWLWGGGICLSSSDHADVHHNTLIDNGSGVTVLSQQRTDDAPHVENYIHDNDVLMNDATWYAIAWAQDWAGVLFAPASNNRGGGNRVHGSQRFAWDGDKGLAAFAATPGGTGTVMLSDAAAAAIRATT